MSVSPTSFARALAKAALPAARLGLDDPDPGYLQNGAVYVQLYVVDGERDRREQRPEVDFAVYSRRFLDTEAAALALEDFLVRYPARVQVGEKPAVLDRTAVVTATREVPWETDDTVTRFIGSYQLATRS